MLQYLVFIGAVVNIGGIFSYIKNTLAGQTKPNRVTWLMWSVAPLIGAFAAWSTGVKWAVLPVFMSGFCPLLVFIASFVNKNSYWKLGRFDYFCGLFSVLALILWLVTKQANLAIVFAIVSDGFASVPTLIKTWKFPKTETPLAFTTGLFNALTSFAAVKFWNFSSVSFPAYLAVMCSLLTVSVYRHKIFNHKFKNSP